MRPGGRYTVAGRVVQVEWTLGDRSCLRLAANFASTGSPDVAVPAGTVIHATAPLAPGTRSALPPWGVVVTRETADG